jgi:glycolate oxidase FAD binding subunit
MALTVESGRGSGNGRGTQSDVTGQLEALKERIRAAARSKSALAIRGGGTKSFYGRLVEGAVLDTRGYAGIVDYEPTELFVTARCGTPLAELERVLAQSGQMLAFEPPHFGAATVGGVVAAGLSGPRRATAGAVRDFTLGVRIVDGRGRDLRFGGQVIKNVAGFDVSRLMVGALGTLGLISEVSLKVLPLPPENLTLVREASEAHTIATMNKWSGQPLPISATCFFEGKVLVRLSGAAAGIRAAHQLMGGERLPNDAEFWNGIREQAHEFFAGADELWRLSVPSTSPPLGLGPTLIEWGGAQRWVAGRGNGAEVRAAAVKACGHATLFRTNERRDEVFTPLAPALANIHRNLKRQFDPDRILNPDRFYADL